MVHTAAQKAEYPISRSMWAILIEQKPRNIHGYSGGNK